MGLDRKSPGGRAGRKFTHERIKHAAKLAAERRVYRIETTGDGAGVDRVTGAWSDVVQAVANLMYDKPTADHFLDVADMLANGIDGGYGWDGNSVTLLFEDGSITVEYIEEAR